MPNVCISNIGIEVSRNDLGFAILFAAHQTFLPRILRTVHLHLWRMPVYQTQDAVKHLPLQLAHSFSERDLFVNEKMCIMTLKL